MDISKLQPDSWSHIQSIVSKNRLGNAYLIHGPSGAGKEAFALKFCSLITGFELNKFINNPNIFLLLPGDSDFYKKLFKSSKMDQKEYQEWNNYWKEKLIFPPGKISCVIFFEDCFAKISFFSHKKTITVIVYRYNCKK